MTRFVNRLTGFLKYKTKFQEILAPFSCNLSRKKYCVSSCDCLFPVLPPLRTINFMSKKVEAASTRGGGSTSNKQSHLDFNILRDKLLNKRSPYYLALIRTRLLHCNGLGFRLICLNKRIQRNLANPNL